MKHLLYDDVEVDVYPVGLLTDLRRMRGYMSHPVPGASRLRMLRINLAHVARQARRRNYWNGYLAEPTPFPEGLRRCGSGWTEQRALNDLRRRLAAIGVSGP